MKTVKVIGISDCIKFDDGTILDSEHEQDCCESHYLEFNDLTLEDFDGLEFDLSSDTFFNRIEDYGIELVPVKGHSVKIPGYGYNNGYYTSNLGLVLSNTLERFNKHFDITECQVIQD